MLVELGDKGFLSLPVSILVCAKDSPSSFNQCSPPGADLAWVDLEPASYLCCGLLTFECLKGYLSLKGGAVLLATLLLLLLLRAYFVILGAGTDLSYLSEILGPSHFIHLHMGLLEAAEVRGVPIGMPFKCAFNELSHC